MMEMCLSGTVASGTRHVRLLDALERSCGGSGSDWDLLESTFACGQKEVKVRWTPGQNSMQIAQVTAPPRVTSRPEHSLPMEQVLCRPLSVVNDAGAEHLRGLEKKRRKRKRRKKKRRGGVEIAHVTDFSFLFVIVFAQTGYVKKFAIYQKGRRFVWGKVVITVCQVFAPAPVTTSAADFTRRLLSPDW